MKRAFLLLLFVALILPAFGATQLVLLSSGQTIFVTPRDGFKAVDDWTIDQFQKSHPGTTVREIFVDLSSGSTMTIDAMLAAGTPPDIYSDTGLRSGKFAVPGYALDLAPYLTSQDIADFVPSLLAYGRKGNAILALPVASWLQGFAVNTDMLLQAGEDWRKYEPASWTTTDFLALAAKLKAQGKYATVLFAKNQSSDSWWFNWFGAFGAAQFKNGDYSKTYLNSPQAVAALNFMKLLVDKGYAPPGPSEIDDDAALEMWATGQVAALVMQSGHAPPAIKSAVDQKIIDAPFTYTFVALPHAPGLPETPATAGPSLMVVHKSNDATRNKLSFELARAFSGGEYMREAAKRPGIFPALLSIPNTADDFGGKLIQAIMAKNGVMDLGSAIPQFSEIRAVMPALLQDFYAGRLTAQQVLSQYEVKVDAILSK